MIVLFLCILRTLANCGWTLPGSPAGVTFNCAAYTQGATCTAVCTVPFYTGASAVYQCNDVGGSDEWEIAAGQTEISCSAATCAVTIPGSDAAEFKSDCTNSNSVNSQCTVSCEEGFYGAPTSFTCASNQDWQGSLPTCTALTCSSLINYVALYDRADKVECASTGHGETCDAGCKQGYEDDSNSVYPLPYRCEDSLGGNVGSWASTDAGGLDLKCKPRNCGATVTDGSSVQIFTTQYETVTISNVQATCGVTEYESRCTVQCREGWGRNAEQFLCSENNPPNGVGVIWTSLSGNLPTCTKHNCGSLIPGLSTLYSYSCASTEYGDTCEVDCIEGYTADAVSTYACQGDGWEGVPPVCTPLSCGDHTSLMPSNTEVVDTCSGNFPSSCNLQCVEGFYAQTMTIYCVSSGNYIAPHNITCIEISLQNATIVQNIDEGEDRDTEWTLFWIFFSIGCVALLCCCYAVYFIYSDPDGDKRGIGKKGLTSKQVRQINELQDQQKKLILDMPEFQQLRSFLRKQDTTSDVFGGLSKDDSMRATSGIALEISDKKGTE